MEKTSGVIVTLSGSIESRDPPCTAYFRCQQLFRVHRRVERFVGNRPSTFPGSAPIYLR